VRVRGHDQLPTFAVGKDLSKPAWGAVFRQMMGRDLVRPDPDRHGALRMTEAARPVLRGEASVTLRRDTVVAAGEREPVIRAQVADEDLGLLALLKAKRRALAEAQNVPAYVVFPDKTLIEMAEKKPATLDQMAGITGVGARKLESYGAAFLEVINGAAEGLHPARMKLAGRPEAALFDRLAEVQLSLVRGEDGTGKYVTCSPSTLRAIAERRPSTLAELAGMAGMGEAKVERFGEAFLAVLRDG
jgi:ATP-dependent DNA helicase RecQ